MQCFAVFWRKQAVGQRKCSVQHGVQLQPHDSYIYYLLDSDVSV